MHALVLLQAAAVDTVAVVKAVHDFLSVLPGIPEGFATWLATLVLGVPVLAMVFSAEWIGALLLRLSPWLATLLAPFWARSKGIVVPILAALFAGGLFHNPVIGLGAGVAWGMLNSVLKGFGKSTPAGLLKAKTVVLVLGALLGLALAGPAVAATGTAPTKVSLLSLQRVSFSPGVGYRWEKSLGNAYAVPFWDVRLGWTVYGDHVKVDGRLGHNVGPVEGGTAFYEARLGLVF